MSWWGALNSFWGLRTRGSCDGVPLPGPRSTLLRGTGPAPHRGWSEEMTFLMWSEGYLETPMTPGYLPHAPAWQSAIRVKKGFNERFPIFWGKKDPFDIKL